MLTSPFRAIGRYFGDKFRSDHSMRVNQSPLSKTFSILFSPFRLFFSFVNFMIHSWATSRSGLAFVKGLPAVGVMAGFFFLLAVSDFIHTEARKIGTNFGYLEFQQENNPNHPEYAEIFAERLVAVKPDADEHKYHLGLAYERSGKRSAAADVMKFISPEDAPGHANGHNWLARYYMSAEHPGLDDVQREELVRRHLNHATTVDPNNQMAHMNMASLFIDDARREKKDSEPYKANLELAIEQLTRVANGRLTGNQIRAIPQLIELQLKLGNEAHARRHSEHVTSRLLPIARKNPEVFDLWLSLVRCSVLIKNYDEALEIVQEGLQLSKDKTVKRRIVQLASMVYMQKANSFQDMSDRQQYIERLNGFCEAIRLNPTDPAIYLKLLDYVNSGPSSAPRIDQTGGRTTALDFSSVEEIWLRDAIIGNPVPGIIHTLLGMRAISNGKVGEGEKHWRIAEQQFPNTQIVVNNLIDVAAKNRPEEFSNILEMITLAIELFPEQPVFYQTRGVYMKNQGNLEAAVADLSYATEKMPKMISLHQYLIICYELLGDEQKVAEQRMLIEEKLSQLDANDRKLVEASIARLN